MEKLYRQPLNSRYLELFQIDENSLIQTATLSKDSYYKVVDVARLFKDILLEINDDLSTMVNTYHGEVIDNPAIVTLIKVEHELAKNAIIKLVHDLLNVSTNAELTSRLSELDNMFDDEIFELNEYTYNNMVWEITTDIMDKISSYQYSTIADIYMSSYDNIENMPSSVTQDIKNIIVE